ncbi:hypothetical protein SARC_06129 [Sphaeroforma arctica JP610]|uniref:Uncharacterized protein n=1 Tax=Sphaeroforma arctica JP610 TaxID=667725 RepID=A0A0L0FY43_9EUKA|nr:hypothetical protein SARC_06129 [Sphaeroforma arctica JP610]KNC81554.1 hypothetical protein SARC_06129 [Sphaeroforma arctica JP610]|eukprot:XP_014155456.1 hypothetical protein SARC_06129 [Sphaeroforma arctica JP610]
MATGLITYKRNKPRMEMDIIRYDHCVDAYSLLSSRERWTAGPWWSGGVRSVDWWWTLSLGGSGTYMPTRGQLLYFFVDLTLQSDSESGTGTLESGSWETSDLILIVSTLIVNGQ